MKPLLEKLFHQSIQQHDLLGFGDISNEEAIDMVMKYQCCKKFQQLDQQNPCARNLVDGVIKKNQQ